MIIGIDRASVDGGTCNWQRARAAGCTFAFLRASEGKTPDKAFATEWPKPQAAGIVGGAYMFWRPTAKDDDLAQAAVFVEVFRATEALYRDLFPPVIDVEFPKGLNAGLTPAVIVERLGHLVDTIRSECGVLPMLYTSARVWREDLKNTAPSPLLRDCPLWLARYAWPEKLPWRPPPPDIKPPTVPTPFRLDDDAWWVHQFAGDAKGFPGFSSTVDLNRFNALARGAKGARVTWVQKNLLSGRARQEPAVVTIPVFDEATENQVRRYQAAAGLVADGVVGPKTFARLCWEGR